MQISEVLISRAILQNGLARLAQDKNCFLVVDANLLEVFVEIAVFSFRCSSIRHTCIILSDKLK